MAGGRPTIKTPELVEAILADLRKGLPRRTAAALHVAPDTFYRWMNEDAEFSDAVGKAEAEAEAEAVAAVRGNFHADRNSQTAWQSAAWWLERRRPDDYRQQNATQLSGNLQLGLAELMREARKTKNAARDAESPPPSSEV
jgi:hypothetical protein